MCMCFVISNKSLKEYTWRVVDKNGDAIARSASHFPTFPECIRNAEKFRDSIGDAAFYDSAGVPIDMMHLSKGSFPPLPRFIEVKHEK